MGEERGRELLILVGLHDRIEELEREVRSRYPEPAPGGRQSLSYQGGPLSPEQERLVLDLIRQMQREDGE